MKVLEFTAGYLFCGSGLGALGTDAATLEQEQPDLFERGAS